MIARLLALSFVFVPASAYAPASSGVHCGESGCLPICGDGLVRGDEACDDGNVETGDGCAEYCAVETAHRCDGEPSSCAPAG